MLEYMQRIAAHLQTMHTREEGQTAVEYALVLLLVALVLVVALATGLGGALGSAITKIKTSMGV